MLYPSIEAERARAGMTKSELCQRLNITQKTLLNSLTTADAPETVYHVRKVFRRMELEGVKCEILHPRYKGQPTSIWALIPQQGLPPTRIQRWCCKILKEGSSPHRCVVLGVRKHESNGRASAEVAETQGKYKKDRITFDFDNGDERIVAVCQIKAKIKMGRTGLTPARPSK